MDTLGFDLDGVLYDWHGQAYTHLTIFNGLTTPASEFWPVADDAYGDLFWQNISRIPTLYERALPLSGVLDTLNNLSKKYNIVYITARDKVVERVTRQWLRTYKFPNYDNVFLTDDKSITVRYHNCKFYVEDRDKHIEELRNLTTVIVMNRDWNKSYPDLPTIDDITDLEELLEEID